jgi:hypothetical protein
MDPKGVTKLNWPIGSKENPQARITPFKIHRGKQPYDLKHLYFIVPKLFGTGGFWNTFDWNKAAELGMAEAGLPYSGKYGFAETMMYWRVNHMVVPAEKALGCEDCHGKKGGRMDWKALGYGGDPMHVKDIARNPERQ